MDTLRIYLKGFGKGFLILVGHLVLIGVSGIFFPDPAYDLLFWVMGWITGISLVHYFVTKFKQPKSWIIVSILINTITIPFLMGSIEVSKNNS